MTILSKLTEPVKTFFKGKLRLYIEYALIAAMVALAGFSLSSWIQRRELSQKLDTTNAKVGTLSESLSQQVTINNQQEGAINQLRKLRKVDSDAIQGLQSALQSNASNNQAILNKLQQLEKNNAQAKALLDTPVPPDLACVLDGRQDCTADAPRDHAHRSPRAAGSDAAALRSSRADANTLRP